MDRGKPSRVRILVADDQTHVQKGLQAVLQLEEDLEVVGIASNGLEAVNMAACLQPDVILMDISMPHLDGIEATQLINRNAPIAVIGMITHSDSNLLQRAKEAGIVTLIEKGEPDVILVDIVRAIGKTNTGSS